MASAAEVFNLLLRAIGALITLSLLAVVPGLAAPAPPAAALPMIVAARVTTTPERARLILDLSAPTKFAIVSLGEPERIAIDVQAGALKFETPPPPAGTGLVSGYTVEQADSARARVVLTLAGPGQVQQAYVLDAFADQPARLVIDVIQDTAEDFAKRVATDAAAATRGSAAAATTTPATAPASPIADNPAPAAAATSAAAAAAPSADQPPPAAAAAAAAVPAEPKGKPLIVLDPGHGGIDSGARGPHGVLEKNVVLAFALKLQAILVKSGRFDVALTRTDDSYLTLEQRVALARQNKADLFISLHADSFSQPQIHGASIYTRDENATDVLDKVLADTENRSEIVAGFASPKMAPAVVDVLVDLMRRQMRRQSFEAAQAIVAELEPSVTLRRYPVRQADFFVLQAPDVPSMLIELGFMSNSEDISNLTKPEWEARVADALGRGIADYFDQQQATP
jgi:N-acetylmuramoyl-L-alanine amidase